jgi:hypothetical protein
MFIGVTFFFVPPSHSIFGGVLLVNLWLILGLTHIEDFFGANLKLILGKANLGLILGEADLGVDFVKVDLG